MTIRYSSIFEQSVMLFISTKATDWQINRIKLLIPYMVTYMKKLAQNGENPEKDNPVGKI